MHACARSAKKGTCWWPTDEKSSQLTRLSGRGQAQAPCCCHSVLSVCWQRRGSFAFTWPVTLSDKAISRDPPKTRATTGFPRLLTSLKAKRDYVRSQLQYLHLNITTFALSHQQPGFSSLSQEKPTCDNGLDTENDGVHEETDESCVREAETRDECHAGTTGERDTATPGSPIMTVFGKECMDQTEQADQTSSQHSLRGFNASDTLPDSRESADAAYKGGGHRERGHQPHRWPLEEQEQADRGKTSDNDDELPLGSEANSLKLCRPEAGSRLGGEPLQDKRLLWLQQNGSPEPKSGWTSFNSELSNLTSGSSANSVEWLLQERQADPEQVLLNLGFGGSFCQPASMFARVPDRFLLAQNAPLHEDDVSLDGCEAAVRQSPSRDPVQPPTCTTCIQWDESGLPVAGEQPITPSKQSSIGMVEVVEEMYEDDEHSVPSSSTETEASTDTDLEGVSAWQTARTLSAAMFSIKMLNSVQQAAGLGMLGSPPAASPPCVTPPARMRSVLHPDNQRALALRGFYGDNLPEGIEAEFTSKHEVKEETEDEAQVGKSAEDKRKLFHWSRSKQRSLVEIGGDEIEHAGEWATSRDSMIKSVDFSTTTESNDSELMSVPTAAENVLDDLSFCPVFSDEPVTNIEDLYFPEQSQSSTQIMTYRKKVTEKLMADLSNDDNYCVSPPCSRQTTVEKAAMLTQAGLEQIQQELDETDIGTVVKPTSLGSSSSVSIVVSGDKNPCECSRNLPTTDGMKFLSIVNLAVDRLSDSGSDHTLVDHQSSSGSESPRPLSSMDTVDDQPERPSGQAVSSKFADLEQGPILYHRKDSILNADLDENDNLPDPFPVQIGRLQQLRSAKQHLDEELPRMNSIHSDSSGFGDAEVSAESTIQDTCSLKVSHLGSSCESSATQRSTGTLVSTDTVHEHPHLELEEAVLPPQPSCRGAVKGHQVRDNSHYISWCYVPLGRRADDSSSTSHKAGQLSGTKGFILGKTRISVVVASNDKPLNAAANGGHKNQSVQVKNENSLLAELTLADSQKGGPETSATCHSDAMSAFAPYVRQPPCDNVDTLDTGRAPDFELDETEVHSSLWSTSDQQVESVRDTMYSIRKDRSRHRMQYHSEGDEVDAGSAASLGGSSVYSCASTTDSIASSAGTDVLDCQKLMKLINQPTSFKGQKTCFVHYKPKKYLRDWPNLVKKKRLQEETRLAQYAVQKFKTELSIMETALMVKYQMAFDEMSQADREDVEEVQCLWGEVRQQVTETEQLLSARMKAISSGNDSFNLLTSISVLQRLMDLLKEQMFQVQMSSCTQEEEEEKDTEWLMEDQGFENLFHHRHESHWTDILRQRYKRGRHFHSMSYLPSLSAHFPVTPYQELRNSLLSEVRQELRNGLQILQLDMREREREIQHLQLKLLGRTSSILPSSQGSMKFPRRETNV